MHTIHLREQSQVQSKHRCKRWLCLVWATIHSDVLRSISGYVELCWTHMSLCRRCARVSELYKSRWPALRLMEESVSEVHTFLWRANHYRFDNLQECQEHVEMILVVWTSTVCLWNASGINPQFDLDFASFCWAWLFEMSESTVSWWHRSLMNACHSHDTAFDKSEIRTLVIFYSDNSLDMVQSPFFEESKAYNRIVS